MGRTVRLINRNEKPYLAPSGFRNGSVSKTMLTESAQAVKNTTNEKEEKTKGAKGRKEWLFGFRHGAMCKMATVIHPSLQREANAES